MPSPEFSRDPRGELEKCSVIRFLLDQALCLDKHCFVSQSDQLHCLQKISDRKSVRYNKNSGKPKLTRCDKERF